MRRRSIACFFVCFVFMVASAQAKGDKFGVGLVPHMNAGDETEQMLFRYVGEMPEIDQMIVINTGMDLLETLAKLRKQGRQLDYLVIAGHGSQANPGFLFGNAGNAGLSDQVRLEGQMIPEDVDLSFNERELNIAKRLRAQPRARRPKGPDYDDKGLDAFIVKTERRIILIKDADGVMKPGGIVMLLNCSAAATDRGKAMVNSIGQITLGKYGGTIVASTVDIRLKEVEDIADRIQVMLKEWENVDWGSPRIYGEWVHFPIQGREKAPPLPVKPPVVTNLPPPMPKAGVFTRTKKSFGHLPKNYEGPEHRIVGDMTPVSFSLTVERKPASEGAITITHVYHGGPLGETLNPGDVVELICVSQGKTSGRYPPNIGGSCHWYVEGGAGSLTFAKDKDGKDESTPRTFVGIASDGKTYPSGTSKTKFTVGSNGLITVRAAQGGYAWGEGTDNWNPAEYVYTFTPAH